MLSDGEATYGLCGDSVWISSGNPDIKYDWVIDGAPNTIEIVDIDEQNCVRDANEVEIMLSPYHNPDDTVSISVRKSGGPLLAVYENIRIDYQTTIVNLVNAKMNRPQQWQVPYDMEWADAINHPFYDPPMWFQINENGYIEHVDTQSAVYNVQNSQAVYGTDWVSVSDHYNYNI